MPDSSSPSDQPRPDRGQTTSAANPAGQSKPASPSTGSQRGLDAVNFFVADLQTSFGPFLAVYLTANGWTQGMIGSVMTASTVLNVLSQAPGGALVDWTRAKRLVIAIALLMIGAGAALIGLMPSYLPVLAGEALHGMTGGVVRSAIAALGLGLVGHRAFNRRTGRNHLFDSLGNALTAMLMGLVGYFVSSRDPFFVTVGFCVPAVLSLWWIRGDEIDYRRARAGAPGGEPAARLRDLVKNRTLVAFAIAMVLFQFGNASIVTLGAERLTANLKGLSELLTSGMVVVPQLVTAAIALHVSSWANDWGRKPLLIAGFTAVVLRAALFAVAPAPWFLVLVQTLDGLTAAVVGIMLPLVVADLTRGTGRFNLAMGAVSAAGMIGASVSTTASGFLAQRFGFVAGFGLLGGAALAGIGVLWWRLPETRDAALQED